MSIIWLFNLTKNSTLDFDSNEFEKVFNLTEFISSKNDLTESKDKSEFDFTSQKRKLMKRKNSAKLF